MDLEDQYRFQVEAVGAYGYEARVVIHCDKCSWEAGPDYEEPISLADLEQRADEHAEVCR